MKKKLSFSKFDAELNTDACDPYNNAELTLTLRIGFRQINPTGGAAEGTYNDYGDATAPARKIIKWSGAAWRNWKRGFVASAKRFWHGKFWLINDSGSFPYTKGATTYYPNVWCRFALVGSDAGLPGIHHTIDVVRLHKSEPWFGSHSTLYDSRDTDRVRKSTTSKGKKVMQRAHVHEVGHLLGLDHVDVGKPHCPATGNTNASACYGVADTDMQAVMGSGMQLRIQNAFPWREALRYFALDDISRALSDPMSMLIGQSSMSAPINTLTSVWPAKLQRHYPRTEAEMKSGNMLVRRPIRGH